MRSTRAKRIGVLAAALFGALSVVALGAPAAFAAWSDCIARIADPYGTGYVSLLNVRVVNQAVNDEALVTEVQFSDDGADWYAMRYTGQPQDWVLPGESGAKMLYVRFVAADGSISPVVDTHITVDAEGPGTTALRPVRAAAGGSGCFAFALADRVSPRVKARLVIRGANGRQSVSLGWLRTGRHTAKVRMALPRGRYTWSVQAVDLGRWTQEKKVAQTLTVN